MAVFVTERGTKIRSQSKSRYVAVVEYVERATGKVEGFRIVRRSASAQTAREAATRAVRGNAEIAAIVTVFDSVTGQAVQAR